jgi:hypothetical protein
MQEPDISALRHNPQRMGGRDPHEAHRAATPLELLFDLTFATSFNFAAWQLADALAAGHATAALLGFGFASVASCWAWINFSWCSSAYDTDDWVFRIVAMVQMIGVLVLAAGVPRLFSSIERSGHVDNSAYANSGRNAFSTDPMPQSARTAQRLDGRRFGGCRSQKRKSEPSRATFRRTCVTDAPSSEPRQPHPPSQTQSSVLFLLE